MKLSIITINYNNVAGLQQTMQSVFEQTTHDFEYIIIDGGSKDGSKELIETHASQLTYWVSEPDGGIFAAMNKGVRVAKGEYCLFLNSGDNLYKPNVIESVLPTLGEADFYTGHLILGNAQHEIVPCQPSINPHFLLRTPMSHQATFIRTQILRERPYLESYKLISDWEQMVYELLINSRTYRPLDIVVSRFDLSGVSGQEKNRALYNEEYSQAIKGLFSPYVWDTLMGRSKLEKKIYFALDKASPFGRDIKIIRNVLKVLPKDALQALRRKK